MKVKNNWSDGRDIKQSSNVLKIANSRGKRPVMTDIKKARNLISGILVELNQNDAKDKLKKVDNILWDILCEKENN